MNRRISLTIAALRLRISYQTARDWVLRGQLDGGRDELGHWFVYHDALERAQLERSRQVSDGPAKR